MYLQCRNEAKVTAEAASEILKHGRETLRSYEALEKEPAPWTVVRMITECGYNKKIGRWHCANSCSLGKMLGKQFFDGELAQASLTVASTMFMASNPKSLNYELVAALSDGIIEQHEKPIVREFIKQFRKMQAAVDILELKVDKEKAACADTQTTFPKI